MTKIRPCVKHPQRSTSETFDHSNEEIGPNQPKDKD